MSHNFISVLPASCRYRVLHEHKTHRFHTKENFHKTMYLLTLYQNRPYPFQSFNTLSFPDSVVVFISRILLKLGTGKKMDYDFRKSKHVKIKERAGMRWKDIARCVWGGGWGFHKRVALFSRGGLRPIPKFKEKRSL